MYFSWSIKVIYYPLGIEESEKVKQNNDNTVYELNIEKWIKEGIQNETAIVDNVS